MIRHDPQRQQKCEEPKDVEKQNDTLGQWKMLREINVESHGQQDEQEDCQRRLPRQGVIARRVCELNHGLDNASELQPTGWDTRDPAKAAQPTDDIRERFLQRPWSEFTDEVVLACGCQLADEVRQTEMHTSSGGRH